MGGTVRIGLIHLGRTAAGPQLTLELARALIALGTSPAVVYSSNAEIADDFAALDTPSLAVATFNDTRGAITGLAKLPRIARQIDSFLNTHGVTTLVVTMEQIWQALISRKLATGRRVLLFVHDATPHTGEDSAVVRWLHTLERRQATAALVLSDHVGTELVAQGTFTPEEILRTVHPAFDVRAPSEARSINNLEMPTIGFFGRMSRYKGLELGAQTLGELRNRGRRVRFFVAGRGVPTDIPGLPHPDDIIDDRWIPQDDVASLLDQFDITLLPYTEASQSGVLAYSMALGIPTVVTPVGGLIEQANDSGCAVIADTVTPTALADSIEPLLDDPALYRTLSESGLSAARTRYSWERTARDVLAAAR